MPSPYLDQIDKALQVGGFRLVSQPIVSLKGDSQESYDVLLRLGGKGQAFVEAGEFLAAAMRSGRMVAIDRWVIRQSIFAVSTKRKHNDKSNLFVNIAGDTLEDEKLLLWICDCLQEFQVRGNWLTFQVREQQARERFRSFVKLSAGLRRVKCRVALTHFGTNPSSDDLLNGLAVDFIKFPLDLGQGLADDKSKQRRVLELVKLAQDRRIKSIATGVEDERTLTFLWTAGVDYVQGNLLQRPSRP